MKKKIPRLMIAGTHSGVGKTSVTLGLMKAFKERGLKVQAFKVGPDYLDPLHHSRITGRPARNLDSWMAEEHLEEIFQRASQDADLILVEGVMGVFDGMSGNSDLASSAEVAKRLKIPVLLVCDAKAMARSFAALVHGYTSFDPDLEFAGVIANRVSGDSHYEYLQTAIEASSKTKLLAYLPPDESIRLPDRHLGLVSPFTEAFEAIYSELGGWVSKHLDLDAILTLARDSEELEEVPADLFNKAGGPSCRVAVARDAAFHFYYEDNLDLLKQKGAEILEFSPLADKEVPECDLLIIGGGYPEAHAETLSKNKTMLASLKKHAADKAVYAECGGMMILCKELIDLEGQSFEMAGVFEESVVMTARRKALGYVEIETLHDGPLGPKGTKARGHEFHYSEIKEMKTKNQTFNLKRPVKKTEKKDGMCRPNIQAGYAHIHFASNPQMVDNLLSFALARKAMNQ
jgi:cobyrinic acid a,c-diamide synthase